MARTPNFNYEKQQRDNAKAAKKAAKAEAKAARKPDAETPPVDEVVVED